MQTLEKEHAENMQGMRREKSDMEAMRQMIRNEIKISDKISYLECSENPLSADIGIIRDGGATWLYDVGDGMKSIVPLVETGESCHVVLSHFHQDHMGNIGRILTEEIYVSNETAKHVPSYEAKNMTMQNGLKNEAEKSESLALKCRLVQREQTIGGLRIFPIPSSHAKGCLGLEVDGTYAFVGDALYCKARNGYCIYNAQLLKEEIAVLSSLQAPYLLVSHYKGLVRRKDEVIAELQEIYAKRIKSEPEICVPFTV